MEIQEIPINQISPSPFQPRETFNKEEIQELADSIEEFDLLNPILVKPHGKDNYQIIAGERRWRAAQFAGLEKIAAIIKDIDDGRQRLESLIENVHRKDLTMSEKGRGTIEIFRFYNIKKSPKAIALEIDRLIQKERRTGMVTETKTITVCNKINKPLPTIKNWLHAASVEQNIIKTEFKKPKEERISEFILTGLSRIDDKDLQQRTYEKIVQQEMGQKKAMKFITQIKKLPEDEREAILTSSVPIEIIGDRTEGYSIEVPEETIEELRRAVEIGEKETAAVLAKPIVQERGRHRRNWQAHLEILTVLNNLFCPYCGKPAFEHLRWICHKDNTMEECKDQAGKNFEEAGKREEADPQFLRK